MKLVRRSVYDMFPFLSAFHYGCIWEVARHERSIRVTQGGSSFLSIHWKIQQSFFSLLVWEIFLAHVTHKMTYAVY